ncbi:MAG: VCBS repeat-containing protein [Clostridia bacterium]
MRLRLIAIGLSILLLAGCTAGSIEDALRLPELPPEVTEFNDEINKIRASGAELIAPEAGTNRQSIQLTDLDGDGQDEGVAFFRDSSNKYKTSVYIFKKKGESYDIHSKIDGPGNTIESVSYADLLGNGNNEIIIGWSLSDSDARSMTVHELQDGGMRKLCEVPYLYYLVGDLNNNGISDLSVVYNDPLGNVRRLALYCKSGPDFLFSSSAPISQINGPIVRIRAGSAAENLPAVYVETQYKGNGLITDIVACSNGKLQNVTYSEQAKASIATARMVFAFCEDINDDGFLDVPSAEPLPGYEHAGEGETLWGMVWSEYDAARGLKPVAYTYYSLDSNWKITLPMEWNGKITASRTITQNDFGGEQDRVVFYGYNEEHGRGEELFSIFMFTGQRRDKLAAEPGRVTLLTRADAVYAAEIKKKVSYGGYDINENMIKERFSYRESEWTSGEVVS